MSQVELQQQLSTLNKQCLLLQEDNEKLLSIVDEQAKYEPSDMVICLCVQWCGLCEQAVCVMSLVMYTVQSVQDCCIQHLTHLCVVFFSVMQCCV